MHPSILAVLAVVVFWIVAAGVNLLLRDSVLDPVVGIVASACVAIIVYRAARATPRND